jgi:hypothetical protein
LPITATGRVAPHHRHDSFVVIKKLSPSLTRDLGQNILSSPLSPAERRTWLRKRLELLVIVLVDERDSYVVASGQFSRSTWWP